VSNIDFREKKKGSTESWPQVRGGVNMLGSKISKKEGEKKNGEKKPPMGTEFRTYNRMDD